MKRAREEKKSSGGHHTKDKQIKSVAGGEEDQSIKKKYDGYMTMSQEELDKLIVAQKDEIERLKKVVLVCDQDEAIRQLKTKEALILLQQRMVREHEEQQQLSMLNQLLSNVSSSVTNFQKQQQQQPPAQNNNQDHHHTVSKSHTSRNHKVNYKCSRSNNDKHRK